MCCSVLFCVVVWCCAAYAASQVKTLSVLVTLADNMKCDVVWCCVMSCRVLLCAVLFCDDWQLMLPANATSLFCWYPLGTWHKLCIVMCAVVFCVILNYPVLCVVASCLCHIQNGYLLFFALCSAFFYIILTFSVLIYELAWSGK